LALHPAPPIPLTEPRVATNGSDARMEGGWGSLRLPQFFR
jgi:hypothetical protein